MNDPIGLYVHIPFCQKKCHYCDFLTFEKQEGMMDKYIAYLCREIEGHKTAGYLLDSLYFGGGTPSYLSADQFARIMTAITGSMALTPDCEITIEMNPESVTQEKIATYLSRGVNRFSMGVQSFDNQVLRLMGRLHDKATVLAKMALLREMGCDNVSLDLMFANPKQDFTVLKDDVEQALALAPDHLSCYSLMIKDHTPFQRWVKTGQIKLYDDELEREMYHYLQERFAEAGFHQYEISSFAQLGKESRHNQKYWHLEAYLGVGLGAASYMKGARMTNYRRFDQYYQAIDQGTFPILLTENLSMEDREKEYIMLNLRLLNGFDIAEINQRFQIDFEDKYQVALAKHQKLGVIQVVDGKVAFTPLGLDVGNQFYLDIL